MGVSSSRRFLWGFKPYQFWRFLVLNVKILRGVDRSKRLPVFRVKYKVSYTFPDGGMPSVIENTSRPHQVGDVVRLLERDVEVLEVRQMLRPRNQFTFLEAICRPVDGA